MVQQDITAPVTKPMEWISLIVVVSKRNGMLQICLDPKDLNKAITIHFQPLKIWRHGHMEQNCSPYWMSVADSGTSHWMSLPHISPSYTHRLADTDGRGCSFEYDQHQKSFSGRCMRWLRVYMEMKWWQMTLLLLDMVTPPRKL